MLSLNLLQSSNITFSKSNTKSPIPNPANRFQNYRTSPSSSLALRTPSSPISQIFKSSFDLGKKCENPFGFFSRISSQKLRTTSRESSPNGGAIEEEATKPSKNLKLAIVFGLWYFQNIVFNIYNKKALNIFPYPWFLASFQLFVGSIEQLQLLLPRSNKDERSGTKV